MSLPTTLMVAAMVMTMGFTVVAVGFNHLSVSSRLSNAQDAYNLAEAAVSRAIEVVVVDPTYGTLTNPGTPLTVNFDKSEQAGSVLASPEGGSAVVTFDTGDPYFSTNNLASDTQATGWNGRIVPPEALHVVGFAQCNGVERAVEALIHVPRFPYVLASSGPIVTQGGLTVRGLKDPSVLDTPGPVPEDQLLPGHLVSNATGAGDDAVKLEGTGNRVTGDVQSAAGATLGSSQVEGEVRTYSDPVQIPDIDILSYDTAGKPDVDTSLSSAESSLTVSGYARRDGDMIVSNGLTLSNGVLFVDGNLTIHDGVSGKGAIVVTGQTQIFGGGSASTDNLAALLSVGDVTIQGVAGSPAKFEGLIYTEGDLNSDYMQLLGVFLANKGGGVGSTMSLDNTEVNSSPDYSSIEIIGGSAGPGFEPAPVYPGGASISIPPNGSDPGATLLSASDYEYQQSSAFLNANHYDAGENVMAYKYMNETNGSYFYLKYDSALGTPVYVPTTGPDGMTVDIDDYNIKVASETDAFATEADFRAFLIAKAEALRGRPLNAYELSFLDTEIKKVVHRKIGQEICFDYIGHVQGGGDPGLGSGSGSGEVLFSLDLSDFNEYLTSMRVLYWTELKTR